MLIVAIAWIYVVLMMSIAEHSLVAAVLTFLLYGVAPVAIILYVMGAPQRKRRRVGAEKSQQDLPETTETDNVSRSENADEI